MSKLTMRKISEILRQSQALKRSYRDIAESLNISISTVASYLRRAASADISWPLPQELTEEALYQKLFLPVKGASKQRPLPNWEEVHQEQRKKGMTLLLLWREYRDAHPTGLGYTQFCLHYQRYVKSISPVMRQVHKAGEKIFVDYAGMTVPWIDTTTGEIKEAQIFVGCLGASQYIFAEATSTQTIPDWIKSHVNMFEFMGGVSEVVVPDNLKSGVTKAHRYDPDINAQYQHFSEHYGFAIVPARAAEPKDKAKVESAVGCIERLVLAPLRHCTFTSIAEINIKIKEQLIILNNQLFQKMQTSRRKLFEAIDKPALKSLPIEKYQHSDAWEYAKVNIDYHFDYKGHYYSVPYNYIQQKVEIRATPTTVECFYQQKRIAAHARSYIRYGHTTLQEHMPPAHQAHAKWTPERLKRWAAKIGSHTADFIEHMISSRAFPQQAFRACLGLLRLGERYGEIRLEKACKKALAAGMSRYQQVESILKNKLEDVPLTHASNVLPLHENIRGSDYYK